LLSQIYPSIPSASPLLSKGKGQFLDTFSNH
jgi:hypothetical protein